MGLGIYSQCTNNAVWALSGTDLGDECMYDMENLGGLPTGSSSLYIETKLSGSCFFDPSYFYEGYAVPGIPAGRYNIILGFGSTTCPPLSEGGNWVQQSIQTRQYGTAYLWTITGGLNANLDSFQQCGNQACIGWTIFPWGRSGGKSSSKPKSASFDLAPKDGSDYKGPPK